MPKKKKMKHLFICVPARIEDLSTVLMIQNECFPDNEKTLKWLMQKLVCFKKIKIHASKIFEKSWSVHILKYNQISGAY